jgi:hypothetical protein
VQTVPIGDHLLALVQQFRRGQGRQGSPCAFLDGGRRDKLVSRWQAGTWQPGEQLLNNVIRNLRVPCQRAAYYGESYAGL